MLLEVSRITNDAEHERALKRLEHVWGASEGDALDELNILTMLVNDYERGRWSMSGDLDPIDIIKGAMEHAGHTRAELVELLGSASRVSEILARKRALTLDMIRTISEAWGIPQSLLTSSYDLRASGAVMRLDAPAIESETIVAIYDTAQAAHAAACDLEAVGLPHNDISRHAKGGSITGTSRTTAPVHEKGFWASIFGGEPDHDTSVYGHSINGGATVITVKVPATLYDKAAAILEKHNPIDVDERAEQYGLVSTSTKGAGYAGYGGKVEPAIHATEAGGIGASGLPARPAMGVDHGTTVVGTTGMGAEVVGMAEGVKGDSFQLAEEFLNVGKRAVRGGTTRIRRYTVEKPVEENVSLHNERVVLDRRPVTEGRVLANADFTDKTISMTEMNEEAVVSKTARVVEEIGLRKEASDRVETVRDTLRKDDVEVEQVPTTERLESERLETGRAKMIDRKI